MSTLRGVVEEILGDRYEIQSNLDEGSFGSVYRARDKFLNRVVAVKSVCLDTSLDPSLEEDLRKRFLREAQVAAQLRHPNIVTVYDIVSSEQASLIIMEFIEGVTLQAVLSSKKRLSLSETINVFSQTVEALDYAHERKVVHRDVKPANIMITPSKDVRVMDFGIAKTEVSDLTLTGIVLGTPDYMSPEQAKGEVIDGRSDLFSLGCVLWECLTGERPFQSGSVTGVLLHIVNDPPPDVDWPSLGLPSGLDGVVKQALAKDPSHRYRSGAALIQALESLAQEVEEGPGTGIENGPDGNDSSSVEIDLVETTQPGPEPPHLKTLREEGRPLAFSASSQDPRRHEEEIFERAERAFLKQDYWETIQLCRHVIESSDEEAKFHHLLGLALLKNVNWQEEAKENLRKATELDPENREFSATLATHCEDEGASS